MEIGIYEEIIDSFVRGQIDQLNLDRYFVKEEKVKNDDSTRMLARHLARAIQTAFGLIAGDDALKKRIELANQIIELLHAKTRNFEFHLIESDAHLLEAIFDRQISDSSNLNEWLKQIMPSTRLSESELFTGSNVGLSLESELKREILSSDRIDFLVSFIKWHGIRIFAQQLANFTKRTGSKLRIITTSYMGATDPKAIEYLSKLPNTEVKVSYNTNSERLHAKAYLFYRNSGFDTGYVGSSNLSKSAMTTGLEWNLKVTTREIPHIIEKFRKTFETYWADSEFETYDHERDCVRLAEALKRGTMRGVSSEAEVMPLFDIRPFPFQDEILEQLQVEREIHNRFRNLVVAATGTGKTVISAFDFKRFRERNPTARLLFVAHRKEILNQSRGKFAGILRDQNFGQCWYDGLIPNRYDQLFASVQILNNNLGQLNLARDYFDFIIIDEVHHIAASSYRPILQHFEPKILLGLTATPERMDNVDILADFSGTIAAEIRLPEAMSRKLLCPFQYFGITDSVDLSQVKWSGGKYNPAELTNLYLANDERIGMIIDNLRKYVDDIESVKALGFCVTQDHARYMAARFNEAGLKAEFLISESSDDERQLIRRNFISGEFNYLFAVDIFNEGVDIPEIDTVLFLRPTESLTVFLQQLGRGLRNTPSKDCLTVLDFVGNARPEYDFEGKFRALVGRTNTSIDREIEADFPHLPPGCSIVLEERARETILKNIRNATSVRRNKLVNRIANFRNSTNLDLSLRNFTAVHHVPLQAIYKNGNFGWNRLCADANVGPEIQSHHYSTLVKAIGRKWLACNSLKYFTFVKDLASNGFRVNLSAMSESERRMCLMLHYDVWGHPAGFESLETSTHTLGKDEVLIDEINEVLDVLIDSVDFMESDLDLPYEQPLQLHARYTRDQILAAFGKHTFNRAYPAREGVLNIKELNTELLFVTLDKSDSAFLPTTMYEDYAIDSTTFHWQSQNSARPDQGHGATYITHEEDKKTIILFVRERSKDRFGNTMAFVNLGQVFYHGHKGSQPMSITWKLKHAMPPFLWKESAKMAVG